MDELSIRSAIMTALVSKIIKSALKKKLGYDIDIRLNKCGVTVRDGKAHFSIDADGESAMEDILKILKGAGID